MTEHQMLILAVVIFVVLIILIGIFLKKRPLYPYDKQKALFTPAERVFLKVLQEAVEDQFQVMGKVRLADVICVRKGLDSKTRQQAFNRISSKHLDYVALNPDDLTIQFAVELDDRSHEKAVRQERDLFLEKALAAAGVPLFRFPVQRNYNVLEIRKSLFND